MLVFALAAFAAAGGDGSETCGEDGLSLPDGFKDVTTFTGPFPEKADEAKGLAKVPLRVVDLQWLQVRTTFRILAAQNLLGYSKIIAGDWRGLGCSSPWFHARGCSPPGSALQLD